MAGWVLVFGATGLLLVPELSHLLGLPPFPSMGSTEKALYALGNQGLETVLGMGIINWAVRDYATGEEAGLLAASLRDPLSKPRGWLLWAVLGLLMAPVAVGASAAAAAVSHWDAVGGKGTVDAVAGIVNLDLPNYVSLLSVTAVLAPLLEEYVFRGFLLASLTKVMPVWAAVVSSSVAFGLCHLSARDLPQLTSLGIVLGFTYVRSKNLLTPMLIHGAWNGTVLSVLFLLVQSGVDLQDLLSQR